MNSEEHMCPSALLCIARRVAPIEAALDYSATRISTVQSTCAQVAALRDTAALLCIVLCIAPNGAALVYITQRASI
jgi:hypothetical protein